MQDFTIHNKPLIHISPDSFAGAHAARAHDLSASQSAAERSECVVLRRSAERSDLSASCCEGEVATGNEALCAAADRIHVSAMVAAYAVERLHAAHMRLRRLAVTLSGVEV